MAASEGFARTGMAVVPIRRVRLSTPVRITIRHGAVGRVWAAATAFRNKLAARTDGVYWN